MKPSLIESLHNGLLRTMNEEIESLQKNLTWKLVEKLKNQKIVGCKWVFKRNEGISRVRMLGLKLT